MKWRGTLTNLLTIGTLAIGLLLGTMLTAAAANDPEPSAPTLEWKITEVQVFIIDRDGEFFRRPPVISSGLLDQQPHGTFVHIDPTDF